MVGAKGLTSNYPCINSVLLQKHLHLSLLLESNTNFRDFMRLIGFVFN